MHAANIRRSFAVARGGTVRILLRYGRRMLNWICFYPARLPWGSIYPQNKYLRKSSITDGSAASAVSFCQAGIYTVHTYTHPLLRAAQASTLANSAP